MRAPLPGMQIISFKHTILLKRGIWLSAAALTAYAAGPAVLDGDPWQRPWLAVAPLCILGGFWIYFLRKTMFFRIVDEVVDCVDHLEVAKGRTVESIPFASISAADVSAYLRVHWITIHLRRPGRLGQRIAFLPQASLWGNVPAIERLAAQIVARARQAGGGSGDA